MIIKEFRIVIPMSVEEYQIGQLYTIQVKQNKTKKTTTTSKLFLIELIQ